MLMYLFKSGNKAHDNMHADTQCTESKNYSKYWKLKGHSTQNWPKSMYFWKIFKMKTISIDTVVT